MADLFKRSDGLSRRGGVARNTAIHVFHHHDLTTMYLPPIIHDDLIDSVETEGYVPGEIEHVMRFGPRSRWRAGAIVASSAERSQAVATRCALLIPRRGRRMRKLALHPALPAEVVKSMLQAL